MSKPRVLQILNRFNLGGITLHVLFMSQHIKKDFEVLVITGKEEAHESSSEHIARDFGIEPRYVDHMHRELSLKNDFLAYQNIRKIIREYKPDIVHTHAAKAGALGRMAALHEKVPVILHTFHGHVFHSYFSPTKTKIFLNIERYLASRTSRIIGISNTQKQELSEVYKIVGENMIEVVPYGFDFTKFSQDQESKRRAFRQEYHVDDDEIAIAIIGRLVPIKNHSLFLQGLKKGIEGCSQKVRAFIVGDGEERQAIEKMADDLNLPFATEKDLSEKKLVTFTSWIKDVDRVTAGIDIVALTSLNEGTPISLIEAQAAHKPIVSTRVGGMEDVVIEGKTALLSPSGDVGAFAANLRRLIEDATLRKEMGTEGASFVEARYGERQMVSNITNLYYKLLEEKTEFKRARSKVL